MPVILLRHTRPLGADGLCYGRTDLDLAPGLEARAAELAASLPEVTRVVSSPLSRCLRLAQALAEARGLSLRQDPDLVEMDFGAWENTPWSDLPRDQLDAWAEDFLHARPHGGESVAQLAARADAALRAASAGDGPALVVTHAGIIKAAFVASGNAEGWRAEIGFGEWCELEGPWR